MSLHGFGDWSLRISEYKIKIFVYDQIIRFTITLVDLFKAKK